MTKKLLIFLTLALLAPMATSNADAAKNSDNELVWICMGGCAYAYHSNSNCSGLNRCKSEIVQVTLGEAKKKGRKQPCQKCYN